MKRFFIVLAVAGMLLASAIPGAALDTNIFTPPFGGGGGAVPNGSSNGDVLYWNIGAWASGSKAEADVAAASSLSDYAPLAGATFTGHVIVPAGSAASPPIGWGDTGLFEKSADVIGFSLAGTERIYLNNPFLTGNFPGGPSIRFAASSTSSPAFSFFDDADTGMLREAANVLGFRAQAKLGLQVDGSSTGTLTTIQTTDTAASSSPVALAISHYLSSGTANDGMGVGIGFYAPTALGTPTLLAKSSASWLDESAGTISFDITGADRYTLDDRAVIQSDSDGAYSSPFSGGAHYLVQDYDALFIKNTSTTGDFSSILFNVTGSSAGVGAVRIAAVKSGDYMADVSIMTRNNTSMTEGLRVKATGDIFIPGDSITIATSHTPASGTEACVAGTITWDTSYMYVCTATDTWKRMALTTVP